MSLRWTLTALLERRRLYDLEHPVSRVMRPWRSRVSFTRVPFPGEHAS